MGHPHLQRLKTKLVESNERLEESNRCIASLRAEFAFLEAESAENIASLRTQCAHNDVERDLVLSCLVCTGCLVFTYLVLSCLVCTGLALLFLSCLVLSGLVWSGLVWSCLAFACL